MLTVEEIKALEFCVKNVGAETVLHARWGVLAADALEREQAELVGQGAAKKETPPSITEIFERYRDQTEKEKAPYDRAWGPPLVRPVPMPTYPQPHYPPYRVGDFPNSSGFGEPIYCSTDFPRTA